MALIRRELRLRRVQRAGRLQPEHAVHDESFDLGVGEDGCGADFDVVEVRDAGRVDGVDAREGGQVVGCVGAGVGEGVVGGDVGVAEEGGVVSAVEELGEQGGFVGGEVEACEVVQQGRDGDEEFFRQDESWALGCLHDDFDAGVAASVCGDDSALQEHVRSEFRERFDVEFAVVLPGRCQESGLQILQDAQAEVLEHIQRILLQEIAESLRELEQEAHGGLKVILCYKVAKRKQQIRRHGIREIKAGFDVGILFQLITICRDCGRVISRRVSGDDVTCSEVHILIHLTWSGERGRREWYVESGEVILDDCGIVEAYDTIVDGLVGGGIGVCVRMAA